ncbi:MAG: hypothetical protein ABI690_23150 [Chloroflexota bacterium]
MPARANRLPLLILALTLAVLFYRLFLGETFFWGLPSLQFYPWREYAFDLLRNGQLPLWNSFNGAGAPLLANYQSALLYPLNWFGLILPLAWSMSITAVLHLFIAGWGMWALTGKLGLPILGRGISTLSFALTGYLVARLGTYPIIMAAAWIPWMLWAALGILTQPRRRDVGWLALFAGMQLLAGHAQTTWYSMLLVGAFAAWWSVTHRPIRWQPLALIMAGVMLGAGIAAVQLLPTGELLAQSQRSGGVDYDFAMNFSYSFPRALNLLSPNVFGTPGDGSYVLKEKGAYFEDAVYIGLIPLIAALAAVFAWAWGKLRRTDRPAYFDTVPFWILVIVVAFIFALGPNTPVFPFLYKHIPTFSLFQAPVRWHIWTVFGLSILAGIGVGAWGHGYWLFFATRLAIAACIGAALLALVAPRFLPLSVTDQEGVQALIRAVIGMGILGAIAGALTLLQPELPEHRWYRLWQIVVWLVIAVDLGYAAQGLNPTTSPNLYDPKTTNSGSFRAYWSVDAIKAIQYDKFLPFDDYGVVSHQLDAFRSSGLANLNLIDRTPLLNNFDPLLVGSFAQYSDLIEKHPAQREKLFQAADVRAIYDETGALTPLNLPVARAWFVESACWHPDEDSMVQAMLDPAWNPTQQVQLLGEGDCPNPSKTDFQPIDVTDENGATVIQSPAQAGWLVIADTNYPGWSVTGSVDNRIYQANLAFKAVKVDANSTVRFEYHPWWIWPGILVSIVSLLVLFILFRTKHPDSNA